MTQESLRSSLPERLALPASLRLHHLHTPTLVIHTVPLSNHLALHQLLPITAVVVVKVIFTVQSYWMSANQSFDPPRHQMVNHLFAFCYVIRNNKCFITQYYTIISINSKDIENS